MRQIIIIVLISSILYSANGQSDIHSNNCEISLFIFDGDHQFNINDTLEYPIINKYKSTLKNLSTSLYSYFTFEKGVVNISKVHANKFNSRLHYTLIFSFIYKEKDIDYCFPIYADINGVLLDSIPFPKISSKNCHLISKQDAINFLQNKWKNKDSKLYISFDYNMEEKCFIWHLSRNIKSKTHRDGIGIYRYTQTIILNAHTGKIIKNTKNRELEQIL